MSKSLDKQAKSESDVDAIARVMIDPRTRSAVLGEDYLVDKIID